MSKKYGNTPLIPYGFQVNKIYPYAGIERFTLDVFFNAYTTYEQAKEFGNALLENYIDGSGDFVLYSPYMEVDNRCSRE